MQTASLIFIALLLAASASHADVRIVPPTPPAPPAPPAPPQPPMPAIPAMPADIPAPPAPPAPPPLPAIPAEAHAACANKASGSQLSFTPGPGERMSGLCQRVDGRMVFELRSYRSEH